MDLNFLLLSLSIKVFEFCFCLSVCLPPYLSLPLLSLPSLSPSLPHSPAPLSLFSPAPSLSPLPSISLSYPPGPSLSISVSAQGDAASLSLQRLSNNGTRSDPDLKDNGRLTLSMEDQINFLLLSVT